jgi:hypothetical protein
MEDIDGITDRSRIIYSIADDQTQYLRLLRIHAEAAEPR